MRTELPEPFRSTLAGATAEEVLRACVHCGMCNATCPTFRLTGDELDGPRGRIYLMKEALEGAHVGPLTRRHLDRCLSCRACETTCPSGVEYHRLLDIGRPEVARRAPRPWPDRLRRSAIRTLFASRRRARLAFAIGRAARPLLPRGLAARIPSRSRPDRNDRIVAGGRRMELLAGCVQAAAAPQFNAAARRVFAGLGIELAETPGIGCCGALHAHLEAPAVARRLAKRNIARWLRSANDGAEAIVVASSGCAAFIADYPDLLADDPVWRDKARRVAGLVRDPVQVVEKHALALRGARGRIGVHEPCTFRHGLKLSGRVSTMLAGLGYEVAPTAGADLCCGSAGAYALLEPDLAGRLRADKIAALTAHSPDFLVTGNIGCWLHLSEVSPVPVRHWLEAVEEAMG